MMFDYAALVLIREKAALHTQAKMTPRIEEREKIFRQINELDIAVDMLLKPEEII